MKKIFFTLLSVVALTLGATQLTSAQCGATYSYQTGTNGAVVFFVSGNGQSFFWTMGNGAAMTSTGTTAGYTFSSNGTYYVCISAIDTASGCNSSNNQWCDTVIITNVTGSSSSCVSSFSIYSDTTQTGVYYGVNTSTGTGLSYYWNWGDGSYSTVPYPSHTYASAGTYTICLSISSANCSDSFCVTYNVARMNGTNNPMHSITFLDPNANGIQTITKEVVNVYPIPASSTLTVEATANEIKTAVVRDMQGRIMSDFSVKGKQLDIAQLPVGIYFLEITKNGQQTHTRFVKGL